MVYRVPTIHIFISVFFIDIGENSKHILYGSSKLFRRKNKNNFILQINSNCCGVNFISVLDPCNLHLYTVGHKKCGSNNFCKY